MQVFAILLPALFVAVRMGKIMMHTQEILFVQAFKTDLKRVFYHRNRRLGHSLAQTFRQVIRTDHPAFIFQHPQVQLLTGVGF